APRHGDEFSRLRHPGVVQQKTVGNRDRAFGSPVAANFSGLGVVPAAPYFSIVDVHHVILVLLRSQSTHESVVVSADRHQIPRVAGSDLDAFGGGIYFGHPSARRIVLLEDLSPSIHAIEDIGLSEAELRFRSE